MPYTLNEPFSLNTLHKRAGGSNETTCSLNDTDIRALRHTGSSEDESESSFSQFAVSAVHTFTVTAATSGTTLGYVDDSGTNVGSISPDPPNVESIYSAWAIDVLAKINGLDTEPIYLRMDKYTHGGDNAANSGWEHLTIGDTQFFRAEADAYNETNSSLTMLWEWETDPANTIQTVGPNPFNMSGTTTVKIS